MRTPAAAGGCHQCSTSPSSNWCAARTRGCGRAQRSGAERQQREHVLELVAEAERAARLVEPGCGPQTRDGERLVGSQRLSIRSSAGSGVRDLTRAEQRCPSARDASRARRRDRGRIALARAPAPAPCARVRPGRAGSATRARRRRAAGRRAPAARRRDRRRRARCCAEAPMRVSAAGRRAIAVAAEELAAVGGEAVQALARRRRTRPRSAKSSFHGIAREQRRLSASNSATTNGRAIAARRAEHPLGVVGGGEAPRRGRRGWRSCELGRSSPGRRAARTRAAPGRGRGCAGAKTRVAGAVADLVGAPRPAGLGRRRPDLAGLLVAQVERLARRVARPGRCVHGVRRFSPLFAAQVKPPPRFGDEEAESRVGDARCPTAPACARRGSRWMTYSRPSAVKPPTPLSKRRSAGAAAAPPARRRRRALGDQAAAAPARRSAPPASCCAERPAASSSTTRARARAAPLRSLSDSWSARQHEDAAAGRCDARSARRRRRRRADALVDVLVVAAGMPRSG